MKNKEQAELSNEFLKKTVEALDLDKTFKFTKEVQKKYTEFTNEQLEKSEKLCKEYMEYADKLNKEAIDNLNRNKEWLYDVYDTYFGIKFKK